MKTVEHIAAIELLATGITDATLRLQIERELLALRRSLHPVPVAKRESDFSVILQGRINGRV